jgi:hypothetical protein
MKKGLITGELTIITSDKSDSVINVTGISNPQSLKDKMRSAVKLSKQKAGVTLHESI